MYRLGRVQDDQPSRDGRLLEKVVHLALYHRAVCRREIELPLRMLRLLFDVRDGDVIPDDRLVVIGSGGVLGDG